MPEAAVQNGVQHSKWQHGSMWTIKLSGFVHHCFSLSWARGQESWLWEELPSLSQEPLGHNLWGASAMLSLSLQPPRTKLRWRAPFLCKAPFFVCKTLFLCVYFVIDMSAVTVRFLFHCFLIAVNCYLNPYPLPLSLSYQKGRGKRNGLFGV